MKFVGCNERRSEARTSSSADIADGGECPVFSLRALRLELLQVVEEQLASLTATAASGSRRIAGEDLYLNTTSPASAPQASGLRAPRLELHHVSGSRFPWL